MGLDGFNRGVDRRRRPCPPRDEIADPGALGAPGCTARGRAGAGGRGLRALADSRAAASGVRRAVGPPCAGLAAGGPRASSPAPAAPTRSRSPPPRRSRRPRPGACAPAPSRRPRAAGRVGRPRRGAPPPWPRRLGLDPVGGRRPTVVRAAAAPRPRRARPATTRSAAAARTPARRRSCSATPSTTRPRPCCSAWPAARARGRLAGMPPPVARRLPRVRCSTCAARDACAAVRGRGPRRRGTTRTTPTRASPAVPGAPRSRCRCSRRDARPGHRRGAGPHRRPAARRRRRPRRAGRRRPLTPSAATRRRHAATSAALGRSPAGGPPPGAAPAAARGGLPGRVGSAPGTSARRRARDRLARAGRRSRLPGGVEAAPRLWQARRAAPAADDPRDPRTGSVHGRARTSDPTSRRCSLTEDADQPQARRARRRRSTPTTRATTCCWSGVLKGAVMVMADLVPRAAPARSRWTGWRCRRTARAPSRSGVVRILKDLDRDITGRHVLVVEDIIDSGLTLSWLLRNLQLARPGLGRGAARCCASPTPPRSTCRVKYVGFDIPNEFVVGYGLDYAEQYRNLPVRRHPRPARLRRASGTTGVRTCRATSRRALPPCTGARVGPPAVAGRTAAPGQRPFIAADLELRRDGAAAPRVRWNIKRFFRGPFLWIVLGRWSLVLLVSAACSPTPAAPKEVDTSRSSPRSRTARSTEATIVDRDQRDRGRPSTTATQAARRQYVERPGRQSCQSCCRRRSTPGRSRTATTSRCRSTSLLRDPAVQLAARSC